MTNNSLQRGCQEYHRAPAGFETANDGSANPDGYTIYVPCVGAATFSANSQVCKD